MLIVGRGGGGCPHTQFNTVASHRRWQAVEVDNCFSCDGAGCGVAVGEIPREALLPIRVSKLQLLLSDHGDNNNNNNNVLLDGDPLHGGGETVAPTGAIGAAIVSTMLYIFFRPDPVSL